MAVRTLTAALFAIGALATSLTIGPAGTANAAGPIGAPALAASPTISPPARNAYHTTNGGNPGCPSGNLCAVVRDTAANNWIVFELYTCNRYAVSNWGGTGVLINHQTGGAVGRLYNQSGGEIGTGYPARTETYSVNWDPVWFVRNC